MWDELGISPCDDPKAIRRAYAARLKKLDPDRDPVAFTRLREALEWALAEAGDAKQPFRPPRALPPEPDATLDALDVFDRQPLQPARDQVPATPEVSAASDIGADADLKWLDVAAADRALLDALESTLVRRDAVAAMSLFYRATATGAVPLHDAPPLLDRLFALVVEDSAVERAAFRDLARAFGWNRRVHESETTSDARKCVMARLVAEDWYDSLLAAAAPRAPVTRKHAKIARLLLGRIGRYRMPRVDSAELKSRLDEFHVHEKWLRHCIDPAWVSTLEKRWRRRESVWLALFAMFIAAMFLNGLRLFVMDAGAGTLSLGVIAAAPFITAFLLWILKLLVTQLYQLAREPKNVTGPPTVESGSGPPDDPEARLRWLEQRAELAYEAMYDAPAGSSSAARYSDVKEFLHDAIALARSLGDAATAERLARRLTDIKAVYRSQFTP